MAQREVHVVIAEDQEEEPSRHERLHLQPADELEQRLEVGAAVGDVAVHRHNARAAHLDRVRQSWLVRVKARRALRLVADCREARGLCCAHPVAERIDDAEAEQQALEGVQSRCLLMRLAGGVMG